MEDEAFHATVTYEPHVYLLSLSIHHEDTKEVHALHVKVNL